MAECRHPKTLLPYCYWCKTGTEPGGPFIPPSQAQLEASTEEALAKARGMLPKVPRDGAFPSRVEIDGMVAILAVQFPDVPAAVLGRILVSAAMAVGAVVMAKEVTAQRAPAAAEAVEFLALAGALLAGEARG